MSLQTPLYEIHQELRAQIVDFAGWLLPVQYASLTEEHKAVRENTGIFDVCHMGRFSVWGPDAAAFLERIVVSRITDLEPGQIRYTVVCNPEGGCKDDILVSKMGSNRYFLVVNASNRDKIWNWFTSNQSGNMEMRDDTPSTGMIAIQGPNSQEIMNKIFQTNFESLPYYYIRIVDSSFLVSRTGYTGEDGFEISSPTAQIAELWNKAVELGAKPCGLGARDSLRLEMGFSLYGHELSEEISPIQAGLGWLVHLDKANFTGREILKHEKEGGPVLQRIAFKMIENGIPRQGFDLYDEDTLIGAVTSGTFSPILKQGIGLGIVSHIPTALSVEIRGKRVKADLAKLPFVPKRVKK